MKITNILASMGLTMTLFVPEVSRAISNIDKNLSDYAKTTGVSGNLSSVGSDTLANLMARWAEEFKRLYPNVNIQIQTAGSSTAPPALAKGTSNIGPMSRKMTSKETEAFEDRHGYKATAIPVAIDALAIYVHKDNPLNEMSLPEVDAVFSSTRKCGHKQNIDFWGQLGLVNEWARRPIQIYGRNSVSGTYGYFQKKVLCKGGFKNKVNEQPNSASVVQSVSVSINGIGYSGIGYKTSGVKVVPLSKKHRGKYVEASPDNAIAGTYPLSRFLYVYVNKHPNKPLPPLEREFITMILSKTGQQILVKEGYISLPAKVAEKALENIR